MVDGELLSLMRESVTIEPFTGRNSYGKPTYGAGVARQCRIERRPRLYRKSDGTEAVSSSTVYLGSAPGTKTEDRITLPDGSKPPIVSINALPDEEGAHHEELMLG